MSNRVTTIRFQRAKQTEEGEFQGYIYLWYYTDESVSRWFISTENSFQAKQNSGILYIDSEGQQELFIHLILNLIFNRSYKQIF